MYKERSLANMALTNSHSKLSIKILNRIRIYNFNMGELRTLLQFTLKNANVLKPLRTIKIDINWSHTVSRSQRKIIHSKFQWLQISKCLMLYCELEIFHIPCCIWYCVAPVFQSSPYGPIRKSGFILYPGEVPFQI